MTMDAPKALADRQAIGARRAALTQPHVAPLTAFVSRLRQQAPYAEGIPDFDPLEGGVRAECLFLLEAPGGKAVGSGFVSRNNPDETAKNFFELNHEAGLARHRTVTWNIVPWYVGTGTKIRAVTDVDIKEAEPHLRELLRLLPNLRAVVLIGRKAQRAKAIVEQLVPQATLFECPHPSPLALNGRAERRSEILRCLKAVAAYLGDAAKRMRVYCDTGAYLKELGELERAGVVSVHQFKYENRSRRITKGAVPSDLKYGDFINYTYGELKTTEVLSTLTYDELGGINSKFVEIEQIVGRSNRKDAQHFDSAHMTGCKAFLTTDKNDLWSKREALQALTGVRVFHVPSEWLEFELYARNGG